MPSSSDRRPARPARIRLDGWGWRHAGRRRAAVAAVDLVVEPGERVLLLGASGAGKSTLLHGIAGLLGGEDEGEETGRATIDGEPAASSRHRVGLVLQDPETQAVLGRVGDDVAFGPENRGVPADRIPTLVRDALDAVGLRVPLDASTSALSGGQKQRLALAGVLAMAPDVLLLDEPTANLDPAGVEEVRDAVVRAAGERTVLVIEHRVEVWRHVVGRVVVLGPDGVLADGSPAAVLDGRRELLDAVGVWRPGATQAVTPPGTLSGETLLEADSLLVGRGRAPVAAPVDLSITAGEALVITGANGAGKSTLALTVSGLVEPVAGRLHATPALADGRGPSPTRWRSRDLLTRIGMVFQSPEHQFLTATVRAELAVGPRALGLPPGEVGRIVDELLERLGLAALAAAHPFGLSGGEQRRLSVATAIATGPRLLVLDEPTFGQDSRTWRALVELLHEQTAAGRALVVVSHDQHVLDALPGPRLRMGAAV